ncbi:hypothetical protein HD806DRAFT_552741 [Xylariaceae sp. AK1471]|nr:hypothetical protein HD806DRAFT_552741 [Xylariaceae sp. AK1471]
MASLTMELPGPEKLKEFHLFTALPIELQLMIWAYWRSDQPVIHHYMFMGRYRRFYAAYDADQKTLLETTAKSADPGLFEGAPLDPMEYKIRFTNTVATALRFSDMNTRRINQQSARLQLKRPAHTWVNFEKDVFFFRNVGYRFPGELKFLFYRIGVKMPKDIKDDHWAHNIRQLAIYTFENEDSLCELDCRAFSQLRGLRKVFIAVKHAGSGDMLATFAPHYDERRGFVDFDEFFKHFGTISFPRKVSAEKIRAQLVGIFEQSGRKDIVVRLMVDWTVT